jgi:hypothetical protein
LKYNLPIDVKNWSICGSTYIQDNCPNELQLPNSDWLEAQINVQKQLIENQTGQIAANADQQDDDKGMQQTCVRFFGN